MWTAGGFHLGLGPFSSAMTFSAMTALCLMHINELVSNVISWQWTHSVGMLIMCQILYFYRIIFCILARVAEKARVRTTPSDLPSTPKPLTPIKTTKEETTNQAEPVGAKSVPNLLQRKPVIRVHSPIKLKDTELGNVTEFSRNRSIIVYMWRF